MYKLSQRLLQFAVFLFVIMSSSPSYAGIWSNGPSMQNPRHQHASVMLDDGRVLVTGGQSQPITSTGYPWAWPPYNDAQIYEPVSNTFVSAPSMSIARAGHTATRLHDGRVLVAGGEGYQYFSPQPAEIFDPVTNTWSPAATPPHSFQQHSAVLLNDGRVLLINGSWWAGNQSIYDPTTNQWQSIAAPPLSVTNYWVRPPLVKLLDGRIFVMNTGKGQIYNPTTNTWTVTSNSLSPHGDNVSITRLLDGKVLVHGGLQGGIELYNPVSDTWTALNAPSPSMNSTYPHKATLLPSGKVLVLSDRWSVLDPVTSTWSPSEDIDSDPLNGNIFYEALLLNSGKVFVTGGFQNTTWSTSPINASNATAATLLFSEANSCQ